MRAIRSLLAIINHFGAFNLCWWYWVVHLSSSWWPWKCVIISVSLFLEEIMKVVRYFTFLSLCKSWIVSFVTNVIKTIEKDILFKLLTAWWLYGETIKFWGWFSHSPVHVLHTWTPFMYFNGFFMSLKMECKRYKWWRGECQNHSPKFYFTFLILEHWSGSFPFIILEPWSWDIWSIRTIHSFIFLADYSGLWLLRWMSSKVSILTWPCIMASWYIYTDEILSTDFLYWIEYLYASFIINVESYSCQMWTLFLKFI